MTNSQYHKMWLDDPVTSALLNELDKIVEAKTAAIFAARRTNPTQLPDAVAELELATRLRKTIKDGEFYK